MRQRGMCWQAFSAGRAAQQPGAFLGVGRQNGEAWGRQERAAPFLPSGAPVRREERRSAVREKRRSSLLFSQRQGRGRARQQSAG